LEQKWTSTSLKPRLSKYNSDENDHMDENILYNIVAKEISLRNCRSQCMKTTQKIYRFSMRPIKINLKKQILFKYKSWYKFFYAVVTL